MSNAVYHTPTRAERRFLWALTQYGKMDIHQLITSDARICQFMRNLSKKNSFPKGGKFCHGCRYFGLSRQPKVYCGKIWILSTPIGDMRALDNNCCGRHQFRRKVNRLSYKRLSENMFGCLIIIKVQYVRAIHNYCSWHVQANRITFWIPEVYWM